MSLHSLKRITGPESAFLLDCNPFDILGLNPRDPDFPNDEALHEAYDRAAAHTHPFATSSTLPSAGPGLLALPPPLDLEPHAPVGSVEAGLPIPGQEGFGPDKAAVLQAAAVAAVKANEHNYSLVLLGRYIPLVTPEELANPGYRAPDGDYGTLFEVALGTFRMSREKGERANLVMGMLDRRGRYYRRIMDCTMEDEPLPEWKWTDRYQFPGWESYFADSCPPGSINYLPRFAHCTELEVMALVRQELALLEEEEEEDAPPLTAGQAA
ncbi:MAG: hypothetical protein M1826_003769 [Phylliscum demangeonii]|nr:MAG: hypothetical protein M1826_003769 [Phylliscum demangeonii]